MDTQPEHDRKRVACRSPGRSRAALAPLVAGFLCLVTTAAHANGRIPGATGLAIGPADERQMLLGLSYGLTLTRDAGASWTWMCEQQIEGNGSDVDPAMVVTSDGTLVVISLTNGGVLVSRDDGCSFERAMGPLEGERGVDLTLDGSKPGHVLALMSTIEEVIDAGYPRYRNFLAQSFDHGRSWQVLSELPDDMSPETVEIAPSNANRVYVTGTASRDPLQGIVERSDDGGGSWTRTTVQLPRGSGSLFLSGIHPTDPDRAWFRVPGRGDIYGVIPARLWRSTDAGASFEPIADTEGGILGFAVSPDGNRIAFGGPLDGLFVAPADATAAPSKVSGMRVYCLRWRSGGLYLCASEPTDPFSLGLAAEPTQGFVPLWRRSETCRASCAPSSTLETTCRAQWTAIAPLVGATSALCADVGSSMPDSSASTGTARADAGSRSGPSPDGGGHESKQGTRGCIVATGIRPPVHGWSAPLLMLVCWLRRRHRNRPSRSAV